MNSSEHTANCSNSVNERRWAGHWVALIVLVAGYVALFAYFYPPMYGIEDEAGFINQALIWSKGCVSTECAGLGDLYDTISVNGYHVEWRNPGRSLLVLPFLVSGMPDAMFASGAIIHVAICLIGALVITRLGASPLYACLLLCHPTLAIYSRTIMGDAPAAMFVLLALYAIVRARRPGLWAGVALACATVMRLHSVVALPFVVAALIHGLPREKRLREAISCSVAGAAGILVMSSYNLAIFDSLAGPISPNFSSEFALGNLMFYGAALACIWPIMLLAPLAVRSTVRWYVIALCFPLLALLCFYYWYDKGPTIPETLVLGQRLLQPAIPVWIVAYAMAVNDTLVARLRVVAGTRFVSIGMAVIGVFLLFGVAIGFREHQVHLQRFVDVRHELSGIVPEGSLVIGNGTLMKLFGVPGKGVPVYRWEYLDYFGMPLDHSDEIADEPRDWFLAVLAKGDDATSTAVVSAYTDRYPMTRLPTRSPGLVLYRVAAPGS